MNILITCLYPKHVNSNKNKYYYIIRLYLFIYCIGKGKGLAYGIQAYLRYISTCIGTIL